jgi:hypothetical protein
MPHHYLPLAHADAHCSLSERYCELAYLVRAAQTKAASEVHAHQANQTTLVRLELRVGLLTLHRELGAAILHSSGRGLLAAMSKRDLGIDVG